MQITLEQFQACTAATAENAARYYNETLEAMERFSIVDNQQVSAFLATVSVETERLTHFEEDLYYTHAERLCAVYPHEFPTSMLAQPYVRNPRGLSQRIYKGYHGRGGIQLTWQSNYAIHGHRLGFDYVGNPDQVIEPKHAMLVAGSYWDIQKINEVATNMGEVTLRVNGPAREALAVRIAQRDIALKALA